MDAMTFARLAAVIIVAVTVTAAAIHLARQDRSRITQPTPPAATESPRTDPLRETLRGCQQRGEAATRDADCLAAWDENRKRFLAPAEGR